MAEFTGLEFRFISADSYECHGAGTAGRGGSSGLLSGEMCLIPCRRNGAYGAICQYEQYCRAQQGVQLSGDGLVGAVIEGRGLPGTIRADRVEFFHNASDALEAVNRGEIDFVYGLASYMEYEIQKNHFTNVVPVTLVNDRMDVSFALAKPADPELLTIINKAVNSI